MEIIMKNWRDGLEKVALTKLQISILNMSLKESKSNVDKLLNNEEVILKVEDESLATEFICKANEIGVNCILSDTSMSRI